MALIHEGSAAASLQGRKLGSVGEGTGRQKSRGHRAHAPRRREQKSRIEGGVRRRPRVDVRGFPDVVK
eukprot:7200723-Pyramimonas_sp.AAC.1